MKAKTSLLTDRQIWRRIGVLCRKGGPAVVAVPYLSKDAYKRLPLKQGSLLVIDFSDSRIKCGDTSPHAILDYLHAGVEVHNNQRLHSKTFAFGSHAIVGSANVSRAAAEWQHEAAIETTDRRLIQTIRKYVHSLRLEPIGEEWAKEKRSIYAIKPRPNSQPPRIGRRSLERPFWLVPLELGTRSREAEAAEKRGKKKARKEVSDNRKLVLDNFQWDNRSSTRLLQSLRPGDIVVEVIELGSKRKVVSLPSRVILLERYREGKRRGMIVFFERPRGIRRKGLRRVNKKLGRLRSHLSSLKVAARAKQDPKLLAALYRTWFPTQRR